MGRSIFVALALFLVSTSAQAQELLFKNRTQVIKRMRSAFETYKVDTVSTDSTIVFDISAGTDKNTKVFCLFRC